MYVYVCIYICMLLINPNNHQFIKDIMRRGLYKMLQTKSIKP